MEINLKDKIILVTGGSGGIGEAISRFLAASKATVAVHFNSNEGRAKRLVRDIGNGSKCFKADLMSPDNARMLFNEVVKSMGSVDVLVNNAGIFLKSPIDMDYEGWLDDWEETMSVNLTSAGILSYEALRHFKERKGGRIVYIASRAAFRGETEDHLAYAASKGGMVSLSRSIARSFGKYNIKSFVIAPGFVETKMIDDYVDEMESILGELSLNELTKPDDIAPVVALIASGMMDHATGCTIDINAGSYMR